MQAIVFEEFGGPEKLILKDIPVPSIGGEDVLVRVKACAINHLDIWIRQGIPAYRLSLPHVSGSDIAGVVEETGSKVDRSKIWPGQKVIVAPGLSCFKCSYCLAGMDNLCEHYKIIGAQVDGGYAEYVRVPAINILPMPEQITFEEAAAFPLTFLTAWHMLISRAKLLPGEYVLILGAGSGVGSAALQIAKLAGTHIIATAGSDEKVEKIKALGVEMTINHSTEDIHEKVKEFTHGKGVDVVFEHVGPATWTKSMSSLAKNGRLVTCGATTGPEVTIDLRYTFMRQHTIMGSIMGTRHELVHIRELFDKGKLKVIIDSVYPLSEARKGQERMLRRESFGKIVLVP